MKKNFAVIEMIERSSAENEVEENPMEGVVDTERRVPAQGNYNFDFNLKGILIDAHTESEGGKG